MSDFDDYLAEKRASLEAMEREHAEEERQHQINMLPARLQHAAAHYWWWLGTAAGMQELLISAAAEIINLRAERDELAKTIEWMGKGHDD